MLNVFFAKVAEYCARHCWLVIVATALIGAGAAGYVARHFAINTDISTLLSPDLPWRQRELAYKDAFPEQANSILAVVAAPTPEFAGAATKTLADKLAPQSSHFRSVEAQASSEFFERNSLLYVPRDELAERMGKLAGAAPLIGMLASDPSLRGLSHTLSSSLQSVRMGRDGLDAMARPLNTFADAVEPALFGRSTTFSWQVLVNGAAATPQQLTNLIAIWPVLDYAALEPGQAATDAIRQTVADAKLGSDYGATVRLTGSVPLADQQFATLREGVLLNALLTAAIVLIVLWLALRSIKIVVAAVLCIAVGLVVTAALGLLMVGAFNPISVAFAVLFVGLGADFAIQFSVRYRAQRHERGDLMASLADAAFRVGSPLTLAAAAAAAGFLAFAPTSYRGVAQLGLIAGCGMVVAYLESITLLPALLWCFDPPGEPEPLGYSALAGADRFLQRHRMAIVITTSLVVLLGLPFLTRLEFNFDPNGLQKSSAEPIETLQRLRSDPRVAIIAAEVLTPAADAAATASKLAALPEVERVATLDSFVPDDGQAKLTLIASAATALDPALQAKPQAAPSDGDDIAALKSAAQDLRNTASESSGAGVDAARRLAKDLDALAGADASTRRKVATAFLTPLAIDLQQIARSLHPAPVTRSDLPDRLVRDWTTPDGLVRTEIVPKGDPDDSATLRRFAQAVLAVEPNATGQAIQIYEWGRTVMMAFVKAGALALLAISILLWLVLRRIGDVLLTLIPLLVAATATLEICAVTGFSLNYANIIALPALLGVGVAFKIYYVMAWRGGEANFLQSSLTRAVFFSAVMTATAFGSLWLSGNPGISSMGKLLSLSLACTLAAAALFQPALMGPPRAAKSASPSQAEPSQT